MNASPIMSAADSRNLLSLSVAATNMDASAAGSGATGLILQAKQLTDARSQLRDGETFSATA
jgi:hypothetical protein